MDSEYGIRLVDFYSGAAGLTPRELSVRVHALPPGSALWRATGGPLAWSDEMHMLAQVEYWGQVDDWRRTKDGQDGNNPPDAHRPPATAAEANEAEDRLEQKMLRHQERALERERILAERAATTE